MRPKDLVLPGLVVVLAFIAWGSAIPGPIGGFSKTLRTNADHFLTGLFSGFKTYNPYDRTERAIDQLQQKK